MTAQDYLENYVNCLFWVSDMQSFPRIIILHEDGECEEGYYSQGVIQGAWHNQDAPHVIFEEAPIDLESWTDDSGEWMIAEFLEAHHQNLIMQIDHAIQEHNRQKEYNNAN